MINGDGDRVDHYERGLIPTYEYIGSSTIQVVRYNYCPKILFFFKFISNKVFNKKVQRSKNSENVI